LLSRAERLRMLLCVSDDGGFRLLFEGNPLPMWVYDVATLAFLEVNTAAVTQYGYAREEFLRMRLGDLGPAESFQRRGHWQHRLKDGRRRDVEIASHTLQFAGRTAALVVAIDVTDLKQAQASLKTSSERLQMLHEIDRALIAAEAPVAIAEAALWRLRDLLDVPRVIVNLFDLEAGEAEWLAAIGRRRLHLGPGVRFPLTLMGDVRALARGELQVIETAALPRSAASEALLASGVQT
jgi:PAS domain S-box-containing protein